MPAGCIFLLSGAAGLVYEVVWFRMLANTFGATGPAIAATTAAFMAGLGIGSHFAGQWADRSPRPARVYAAIEALIAVLAMAMPATLRTVEQFLDRIAFSVDAPVWREATQFTSILLLLVIPTALMGATLPVLARSVVHRTDHLGRRFAWLYGMNTLGAAVGALVTGFFLIPQFGIQTTTKTGVILNLCAAVGALLCGRSASPKAYRSSPNPDADSSQDSRSENRESLALGQFRWSVVHVTVFFSGFVALACQYHWTRSLIFSFDRLKNTTYSFSAVLSVTLLSLVIGSLAAYLVVDRLKNLYRALATTIALIGASVMASTVGILRLPPLHDVIDPQTLRIDFAKAVFDVIERSALILGVPTILMGAALPLAVRTICRDKTVGRSVGRLYACNTWGAVAGAIMGAYLLTPIFGLLRGLVVLGAIEILLAVWLFAPRPRFGGLITLMAIVLLGLWGISERAHWPLAHLRPGEQILRYRDGPMATVCVIESSNGERRICVDDVPVAGTSEIMQTDQKSLAHWGMMLAESPRRVLTVGFGSGGASYSFLLHDRLKQLDCVEICRDVPKFADLLTSANHGITKNNDPRYRIIYADARAYLQRTATCYDVIVSDCTDLRYRSSANLYDLEYFELCRDRLSEQGCAVIWMPLGGLPRDAFQLTLRTFGKVFPNAAVFYLHNRWTHYVLLAGLKQPPQLTVRAVRDMLKERDVAADLAEIGMTNPYKILATFLTSFANLQPILRGDEVNTEDHPQLEFSVPKYDTGPWSAQRNLNLLRRYQASVQTWLLPSVSQKDRQNVERYEMAAAYILAAQEAEGRIQIEAATQLYLAAKELTPEDPAIGRALRFPALREVAELGQPTAWVLLGRSEQLQGRYTEALACFERYEKWTQRIDPPTSTEQEQMLLQARAWRTQAEAWRSSAIQSLSNAGVESVEQ